MNMSDLNHRFNSIIITGYAVLLILLIILIFFRLNKDRLLRYFSDLKHTAKIVYLDRRYKPSTFVYTKQPVGIVLGRLPLTRIYVCSPAENEEHILFSAPSGSGKTMGPVIMTLLALFGLFFAFVIDISGDIYPNIPGKKKVYSPFSVGGCKYNVFAYVDSITAADIIGEPDMTVAEKKAEELRNLELMRMTQLIYSDYQPTGAAAYYGDSGLTILQAAMIAGYNAGLDFPEICKKVYNSSFDEIIDLIEPYAYADNLIKEYKNRKPDEKSKFKENLNKTVKIFATDPYVSDSFGRGPDSISPYSLESNSVYICIPDNQLLRCKQLLHVISAQVVDYLLSREYDVSSRRQPKILLCLDELTSLGHLSNLCGLLQRTRKHGTRAMLLTQDISDLEMVYPDEHRSMLSNLAIKVILGGINELDSTKYFSEMIGKNPDTGNRFYEPEEIRTLGRKKAIVLFNSGHIVIRKVRWFEEHKKKRETSPPTDWSSGSGVSYKKFIESDEASREEYNKAVYDKYTSYLNKDDPHYRDYL